MVFLGYNAINCTFGVTSLQYIASVGQNQNIWLLSNDERGYFIASSVAPHVLGPKAETISRRAQNSRCFNKSVTLCSSTLAGIPILVLRLPAPALEEKYDEALSTWQGELYRPELIHTQPYRTDRTLHSTKTLVWSVPATHNSITSGGRESSLHVTNTTRQAGGACQNAVKQALLLRADSLPLCIATPQLDLHFHYEWGGQKGNA
jgi:hypothetical protein